MMSDLTVSEKRLLAAMRRIEDMIDRAVLQTDGPQATPGADQDLAAACQRLSEAGQQAAQLAEANDALIEANRQLLDRLDAGGSGNDEVVQALEAELHAMRALRAAEEAQMAEILDRLDQMGGQIGQGDATRQHHEGGSDHG